LKQQGRDAAFLASILEKKVLPEWGTVKTWAEDNGIGLAIVRQAAERMAGRAGFESAVGEGSRFWIELLSAN
jgi:light-regulated signal transduction histidine kinase (bacteriophytochrome)